jgi:hypothetical protein
VGNDYRDDYRADTVLVGIENSKRNGGMDDFNSAERTERAYLTRDTFVWLPHDAQDCVTPRMRNSFEHQNLHQATLHISTITPLIEIEIKADVCLISGHI